MPEAIAEASIEDNTLLEDADVSAAELDDGNSWREVKSMTAVELAEVD